MREAGAATFSAAGRWMRGKRRVEVQAVVMEVVHPLLLLNFSPDKRGFIAVDIPEWWVRR